MFRKLNSSIPKYLRHFKYYSSSGIDFLLYHLSFKNSKNNQATCLLFTTEDPRIDIIRFYQAFKKKEPNPTKMLLPHSKLDGLFEQAGFKEVIYYRNHWDFRLKIKKIGPIQLAHVFTRRCYTSQILIQEFKIPVVLNIKDTSVASHGLNPPHWYLRKELPSEKYSFQHANGLIAESLELSLATRLFQLTKHDKRLYFPNYCEAIKNKKGNKKIDDGSWHFVYVGSVRGSQDDPKEHGNIQMHWLIQTLDKQGIHFHIYPNPNMDRVIYDEYFALDKKHDHFHMHESLNPDELANEISQYHFGLIPFFNEDTGRSPLKRQYSSSLKIFNYIESALPVLISKDMGHQRLLLSHYGLAIGVDKLNFHDVLPILDELDYQELIQNLEKNRESITIENQIHRVHEFNESILESF